MRLPGPLLGNGVERMPARRIDLGYRAVPEVDPCGIADEPGEKTAAVSEIDHSPTAVEGWRGPSMRTARCVLNRS